MNQLLESYLNHIQLEKDDKIYPRTKEFAGYTAQALIQAPFVAKAADEIENAYHSGGHPLKITGQMTKSFGKALLTSGAAYLLFKAILAAFSKCKRQCGWYHVNLPARQLCIVKCKINRYTKELQVVRKTKGDHKAKIRELEIKIKSLNNKKVKYEKWIKARPRQQKYYDTVYKKVN